MKFKTLRGISIALLIIFSVACKKENLEVSETEDIILEPEKELFFPDQDDQNIIFKTNLTGLSSMNELPKELEGGGNEQVISSGILLDRSVPFKMSKPSIQDRVQFISEIVIKPNVKYLSTTNTELSLATLKNNKIPFKAKLEDITIYTGKSLFGIAGTVFGLKITSSGVYVELYRLTSSSISSSRDDAVVGSKSETIPITEFFGDVKQNYWESFNLRLTITKDVNFNHIKIENLQTGAVLTCEGRSNLQSNGCMWGYGFIRAESNQKTIIQKVVYRSLDTLNPEILFLGHSFIEGNSLSNIFPGYKARYASLIKDALSGNAVIAGMGGAKTNHLINVLDMDLYPFTPKYVVVDGIANETSFESWKNNMDYIIQEIKKKNAVPVLVTGAPRLGYEAVINQANHYIRNVYEYPYLDLNDIVAENQSSTIWKPGFSLTDGVHPSIYAHEQIAKKFYDMMPELFLK
ncbi:SGNH/GDSL hydrolase family protein [Pedobacter glucosidilyticus]|uniref:SGNH/GDSL hydrolase family protein n=1 Tax=Pedobacter glucosidilyticus TaxID=1122941 RepID=UPI0026F3208A|nr:SGNH/GDSL hydrolase family protein [Pedobacter glucosidilyticus]